MEFVKIAAKDLKVGDRIDYDDHTPVIIEIKIKGYIEIHLDFGVTQLADIWEPNEYLYKVK